MMENGESLDISLVKKKLALKASYGNCCLYCCQDFTNQLSKLEIHHRDYLGYLETSERNPFDPKLAAPACSNCHSDIHIAASAITLGFVKSIPLRIVINVLVNKLDFQRGLVMDVVYELRKIGIYEYNIGYVSDSRVCRILLHAMIDEYLDELEDTLEEAMQAATSHHANNSQIRST